jgi:hypothetical protein
MDISSIDSSSLLFSKSSICVATFQRCPTLGIHFVVQARLGHSKPTVCPSPTAGQSDRVPTLILVKQLCLEALFPMPRISFSEVMVKLYVLQLHCEQLALFFSLFHWSHRNYLKNSFFQGYLAFLYIHTDVGDLIGG